MSARYWRIAYRLTRVKPPTQGPGTVQFYSRQAQAEARISVAFAGLSLAFAVLAIVLSMVGA